MLLEMAPDIGRPFPEMPELRELVIAFGDSGYVALYRHEPADDAVYVLAFRHQRGGLLTGLQVSSEAAMRSCPNWRTDGRCWRGRRRSPSF